MKLTLLPIIIILFCHLLSFGQNKSQATIETFIAPESAVPAVSDEAAKSDGQWIYPRGRTTGYDYGMYWVDDGQFLGYVFGNNYFADIAYGQRYVVDQPYDIQKARFWFHEKKGNTGSLVFTIWDFANGRVGNVIASRIIPMSQVTAGTSWTNAFEVVFDQPVRVTRDYVIGVDLSRIEVSSADNLVGNRHSAHGTGSGLVWVLESDGEWVDPRIYEVDVELAISPFISYPQTTYSIIAEVRPAGGGTVSGTGIYNQGQQVTLRATPATGYSFDRWTENGVVQSTNPTLSFTATRNRNLVAEFSINRYSIQATVSPAGSGTISGTGNYQHGQQVTLTATPLGSYSFIRWVEDGVVQSNDPVYVFTATRSRNLIAEFERIDHAIQATVSPAGSGTISGAGTYQHGQQVTLTATPLGSYSFIRWVEDGVVQSNDPVYTFTATRSRSLVAEFSLSSYTIQAIVNPPGSGTVSGAGNYVSGQQVTLVASPVAGYSFDRWTEDGVVQGTNPTLSFNATRNRTLVAEFSRQHYSIQATASPVGSGSISGTGSYEHGQQVTLIATPTSGFTFSRWVENGLVIGSNPTLSFTASSNRSLTAEFSVRSYIIKATAGIHGSIVPAGDVVVFHGANQSFQFVPNEGYRVSRLLIDNQNTGQQPLTYTFSQINGPHSIHVDFERISYTLTYTSGENGSVQGETLQTVFHGESGSQVVAVPDPNHYFVGWSDGRSDNPRRDLNVTSDLAVTAEFAAFTNYIGRMVTPSAAGEIRLFVDGEEQTTVKEIAFGSLVKLIAEPTTGYIFDSWQENLSTVSYVPVHYFVVERDRELIARFVADNSARNVTEIDHDEQLDTGGKRMMVYPNPSSGRINVVFPEGASGAGRIDVITQHGQSVYTAEVNVDTQNHLAIDIGYLPTGLYVLNVVWADSISSFRILLVE